MDFKKIGREVYRTPLPSTYKKTEISEDLNDGMEWVFRDYVISLKQSKDTLLLNFGLPSYPYMESTDPVNIHLLITMCKALV